MVHYGRTSRATKIAMLATLGVLAAAGAARAGDCNTDIADLSQKRQTYITQLNTLAKGAGGKLDPAKSCPQLRGLVVAEAALVKYLQANKNWCNVPDDAVSNLQAASVKSQALATQACNFAAQMKKQQQEAASSANLGLESQKLPTGPL